MPSIPSLILTGRSPINTYTSSVGVSGSVIADGLGNQITSLQLTSSYSLTASFVQGGLGTVLVSSDTPLVDSNLIISASSHGFGTTPKFMQVFMVNKAATNTFHGYSVGDIVSVDCFTQDNNDGTTHPGFLLTAWANSTLYSLSCQVSTGTGWRIAKKDGSGTTFTSVAEVVSDWNARVVLSS